MLRAELLRACHAFDGKHTDPLQRVALKCAGSTAAVKDLLTITADAAESRVQVAATWLLMRISEGSKPVLVNQAEALVSLLTAAAYWETKLHLLQILDRVDLKTELTATVRAQLFKTVMACLRDENKLVRAWSLSLLGRLAAHLPRHRADIARTIRMAESSEAASVRARIRRLRKDRVLDWMD